LPFVFYFHFHFLPPISLTEFCGSAVTYPRTVKRQAVLSQKALAVSAGQKT
jgi:hypothetical protein